MAQGYLAPHKLDPRMLDPRFVFKVALFASIIALPLNQRGCVQDVAAEDTAVSIRSFEPKKKARKNRAGYSGESDVLIGDRRTVTEYVECEDPILFLYKYWVLTWDDEAKAGCFLIHTVLLTHTHTHTQAKYWEHTSEAVRELMEDLKLLNKGDAKQLLKWRNDMRALHRPKGAASCVVLRCIALYCDVLRCIALYCDWIAFALRFVLHCIAMYCV